MVRLSTSLTLIFSSVLLCMVHSSDAACKQMGQFCTKSSDCCNEYHCDKSRQRCEMNSSLNSHDRFCINMFVNSPGCDFIGVGSPIGYCDCNCPRFNPHPQCTILDMKLKNATVPNIYYKTESSRNKEKEIFDQYCQKQIEYQDRACSSCDYCKKLY